ADPPPSDPPRPWTGKPLARSEHQRLSPAVRRLAAENRLDLRAISGSGRNGRITRRDVTDFIAARESRPAAAAATTHAPSGAAAAATARPAAAPAAAAAPAPAAAPTPPAARAPAAPAAEPAAAQAANFVPFTRIRRLTAEHMVRSKATSAH